MGEIGIESTKKAVEWQKSPSLYQVSNMEEINSRSMDFSPMYGGKAKDNNVVIFVSSREESIGNKEDGWTGESFMDLYTTSSERKRGRGRGRKKGGATDVLDVSKLGWSTPVPLDEEEILNTVQHEGSATFDSRKKKLYFTKCVKEKEQQLGCGIWMTEKVGKSWKQPEPLIIGKDSSSNVGHPSLSPDDKLLYFVSTDYSSRGGRDIFVTSYDRKAKAWKTPKNLGPKINTERDEYYPHANKDGYLYFSSNGLPGMGGLDIYRIKVGKDGMPLADAKPENLKYPVNTNWDDFGIVFEPGGDEKGFLSSNRKGGKGSDDIYAVFKTPVVFNLEGIITSSKTGEVIPEATVSLVGSDGESIQVTADKEGKYFFGEANIKRDVTYKLTAEKKKFLSNVGDATTVGIPITAFDYLPAETKFLHIVKLNIALDPIDVPIVLPNVFFDLAKANLRPESKIALDTVVTILNNNPRIVIEMRSHTDYRDSEEKNAALSQRRADSCVAYIIKKGIAADRLVARGMGEGEPFVIPAKYKGYGSEALAEGNKLTERFIKKLSAEKQEIANQINRRTDFKVLRDDYVPKKPVVQAGDGETGGDTKAQDEPEEAAPGEIYIIEKRESFGIIARKNKISIQQLKKLNGGLRGVRAVVGLQLKIDPKGDYTEWDETHYQVKKRNENFKSIAKQFDMDDDDLEDLNPDMDPKKLAPGIWVKIK
jgi:peptidoglycan-associated lipoprotein